MRVHSPAGAGARHDAGARVAAQPRPASLAGLRIGLLDNTKAPVDRLMRHLQVLLERDFPDARPFCIAKTVMSRAAEPAVMAALRRDADVLITGLAD